MKIEHFAFNVSDPVAIANWYVAHLGMSVVRKSESPSRAHFLADESGSVMIEIYCNPPGEVPNYAAMNPLLLHLAFVSDDPNADLDRLVAAGAMVVSDQKSDDGSQIVMLRDPWGFSIQLCKRAKSMLRN